MARRVVITSVGVVSSLGCSPAEIIGTIKKGEVCFERPSFDSEVAVCAVKDFNLKEYTGRFKDARYLNRGAAFSVASAMGAINHSGLDGSSFEEAGLFAGAGPNFDLSGEFAHISDNTISEDGLSALWILKFLPNTAVSAIARLAGIHGENATTGSACAASMTAIGDAFRRVKDGYLDLVFAGGGDSRLSPGGILAYKKARALWSGEGDPESLYAPFGTCRRGFVPGEGGAFFLLEELEHARRRGAVIEAEVLGYGSSLDGYNMTAPEPGGKWAEKAVTSAISGAGLDPSDIGVVSAHGTGTQLNDQMEAGLIKRVFGEKNPRVTALKSWTGHLASACGAVELAVMLAGFQENILPGIHNLAEPLDRDLPFVRETTAHAFDRPVLLENFGFGGQNSAIVIKKMERITINTGLAGFVMLERILERDDESITLTRHFSDAPLFTGVETLAQSGCIHVRYLEGFQKHAFLLKIDELNHCVSGDLSGEYTIRGWLTGRASNAYSYAMTLSLDGEVVMEGVFLFATREYDADFRQDKITEHYREVFSCLTRDL